MTGGQLLLAGALAVPLLMLAACVSLRIRDRMPALLAFAPLPALAAAVAAPDGTGLVLPKTALGLTFVLDRPGAMLLGTAALLWIAAGTYARASLRGEANSGRFAAWWLMTLAGNLGVFVAADLVSFYVFFTLVSLAAYGLVVHDGTPAARHAGTVYMALAVLRRGLPADGLRAPDCSRSGRQPCHPRCSCRTVDFAVAQRGTGVSHPGLRR